MPKNITKIPKGVEIDRLLKRHYFVYFGENYEILKNTLDKAIIKYRLKNYDNLVIIINIIVN